MDVLMPQPGETVAEAKITTWFKAVGDTVKPGDNLFEIERGELAIERLDTDEIGDVLSARGGEDRVEEGAFCRHGARCRPAGDDDPARWFRPRKLGEGGVHLGDQFFAFRIRADRLRDLPRCVADLVEVFRRRHFDEVCADPPQQHARRRRGECAGQYEIGMLARDLLRRSVVDGDAERFNGQI